MEKKIYRIIGDNLVSFDYWNKAKDLDLEKYILECVRTGNNCEIEIENLSDYCYNEYEDEYIYYCEDGGDTDYDEYGRKLYARFKSRSKEIDRDLKRIEQLVSGTFKNQNNNDSDDNFGDDYERDTFYALSDGSGDMYSGDEYNPDDDACQWDVT